MTYESHRGPRHERPGLSEEKFLWPIDSSLGRLWAAYPCRSFHESASRKTPIDARERSNRQFVGVLDDDASSSGRPPAPQQLVAKTRVCPPLRALPESHFQLGEILWLMSHWKAFASQIADLCGETTLFAGFRSGRLE